MLLVAGNHGNIAQCANSARINWHVPANRNILDKIMERIKQNIISTLKYAFNPLEVKRRVTDHKSSVLASTEKHTVPEHL